MSANQPPSIYRQLLSTSIDSMVNRIQQVYREEPTGDRSSLIVSALGLMEIYDKKIFADRKIIDRVIILTYAALSRSTVLVVQVAERIDKLRKDIQSQGLHITQVSKILGLLIKEHAGDQQSGNQDEAAFERFLERTGRGIESQEQPPKTTSAPHSPEAPNYSQSGSTPNKRATESVAQTAFTSRLGGFNGSTGAQIRTKVDAKTNIRYGPDVGPNGIPDNVLTAQHVDLSASNRSTNEQILNDGECNISYGPRFH